VSTTTGGGGSSEREPRIEVDEEVMKEMLPQSENSGAKGQRAQTHMTINDSDNVEPSFQNKSASKRKLLIRSCTTKQEMNEESCIQELM
jgi:hypothetical protein